MSAVTIVSSFAAMLSIVSFVPQTWATIRLRNTDGISLKIYLITVAGFVTWLAYSVLLGQWAIIVQNVICLGLSSFILAMKLGDPKSAGAKQRVTGSNRVDILQPCELPNL